MILVTGLTLPNCCVCPKLLSRFPSPSVVSRFKTLRFKREVVHMIIFDYTIGIHHYCFILDLSIMINFGLMSIQR